ncbi:MAG: hypothetical protein BWY31_02180 [Lentisphaerae bacterium ADurb.Bin242]|nr:MAG: hypothetical protein BWY31_02180 [Lentisphaerae bacterium ADurb.Bin242]
MNFILNQNLIEGAFIFAPVVFIVPCDVDVVYRLTCVIVTPDRVVILDCFGENTSGKKKQDSKHGRTMENRRIKNILYIPFHLEAILADKCGIIMTI